MKPRRPVSLFPPPPLFPNNSRAARGGGWRSAPNHATAGHRCRATRTVGRRGRGGVVSENHERKAAGRARPSGFSRGDAFWWAEKSPPRLCLHNAGRPLPHPGTRRAAADRQPGARGRVGPAVAGNRALDRGGVVCTHRGQADQKTAPPLSTRHTRTSLNSLPLGSSCAMSWGSTTCLWVCVEGVERDA